MDDIETVRARLEVAELSVGGLAGLLEAAWDGFALLLAACRSSEDGSAGLYAAFSFAAARAAEARLLLWAAPSLPRICDWETGHGVFVADDLEGAADGLARLADVLSTRLSSASRTAAGPGDQGACADAAGKAAQIYQLLARNPS
ncbi:MAG: hypothetical protein ACRDPY_01835 [Streptosporangiaceae bacterium]